MTIGATREKETSQNRNGGEEKKKWGSKIALVEQTASISEEVDS